MNLWYKENKSCTKGQLFSQPFFFNENSTKTYLVVVGYMLRQLCQTDLVKKLQLLSLHQQVYIVLDYHFEQVILSILELHLFLYSMLQWMFFSSIKGINRLISKGISNICLKVNDENQSTLIMETEIKANSEGHCKHCEKKSCKIRKN